MVNADCRRRRDAPDARSEHEVFPVQVGLAQNPHHESLPQRARDEKRLPRI